MTQEQFSSLQELHRLSGLSLVKFLQREHVSYSTYNYWKRKGSSSNSVLVKLIERLMDKGISAY